MRTDFEPALLEPRPQTLLETPLGKPTVPTYVAGPHDDERAILRRLDERVGPDKYQFVSGLDMVDALLDLDAPPDPFEDEADSSVSADIETTAESTENWTE